MDEVTLDRAATTLAACDQVIALTGAGISVESGIPDFRSPGGLWDRFDPAVYAQLGTFLQHPERSWEMFLEVEQVIASADPNPAHYALADLERDGILRSVITQNIDGLHQAAGSRNVREFHGTHAELHCVECGRRYGREAAGDESPPRCSCGRILKPAVVLFGESIPEGPARASAQDAELCDAMLVVGTSAEVYPAAAIPYRVSRRGLPVIAVDLQPTSLVRELSCMFLQGSAGDVLPQLVDRVRQHRERTAERGLRMIGAGRYAGRGSRRSWGS